MSLYNYISENVLLNISDLVYDRSIGKYHRFLDKSQWWSMSDLTEYQNIKLRELITHAYYNVPYYNSLFRKLNLKPEHINSKEDLNKLPILSKNEIRKNFPDNIVAKNLKKKDYYSTGSSGSTGEPLKYLISKEAYSMNTAAKLRGWYWMGYRLGDKFVKLSQNPRNKREKLLQDFINRNLYLYAQQLTGKNFEKILNALRQYQPKIIRGYPDPLLFLAEHSIKLRYDDINPVAINTTGNILYKEAREVIENQFNCKIFDSYNAEGGATAFECPTHGCYHLAMEYAITEIVDDNGIVGENEKGKLITTDLINFAMPFIRYDTQDIVTKGQDECSCGRNLETIHKIDGRNNDILITPSGKYLIVHNFTGYFQRSDMPAYGKVEQFQIVQPKPNSIIIKIKRGKDFSLATQNSILKYWKDYIGSDVDVEIEIVDNIPLNPSGKRRFLIRNPEIPLF